MDAEQGSSAPPIRTLQLQLNGAAVVAPVYRAVRNTNEVLSFALDAIEKADLLSVPPIPGGMIGFSLGPPEPVDVVERKETYTNWLLSKAFQDLARAMNEALQEAYCYVEMFSWPGGRSTLGELQKKVDDLKTTANKKHFPELLQHVGDRLHTPLNFSEEYASLQKVRNCLEHRGGVVSDRDVDAAGKLRLRFPTFQIVIRKFDGTEVAVEQQADAFVEGGESIAFRVGRIEKEYSLGERISLTPLNYIQIAQGCVAFCLDLGAKLPVRDLGTIPKTA